MGSLNARTLISANYEKGAPRWDALFDVDNGLLTLTRSQLHANLSALKINPRLFEFLFRTRPGI